MRRVMVVLLSALSVIVSGVLTAAPANAIVEGAVAGHLRGAAQLYVYGQYTCSASLIAPTWIMTAKHCITNNGNPAPRDFYVNLGDRTLGGTSSGQRIRVKGYTGYALADLALMELEAPARNNEWITEIVGEGLWPAVNTELAVSGWGATAVGGDIPAPQLKVCTVKVLDRVDVNTFSGFGINGFPLTGDSGGPVSDARHVQVGVTARVDVQARIGYFVAIGETDTRRWIRSKTGV
ncbi:trypsin-like serine protease [Streptomyces sp. NPDC005012]|uniref:S1 family peptidase n=1 Tax=unclassified Streptomyces TaxID=2593676 RepID=UPI0033B0D92C